MYYSGQMTAVAMATTQYTSTDDNSYSDSNYSDAQHDADCHLRCGWPDRDRGSGQFTNDSI